MAVGELEEEGEEERGEGVVVEVEGRVGGKAFLFFRKASQHGAAPGHHVWLGLPHDEQLVGQLAWLQRLLVCGLLPPVWPPVCLLVAAVWLCLALLVGSSQLAISC